jgi:hypothetical protein
MSYQALAEQCVYEEWRPIPNEPHYEASNIGRVRSCYRGVHKVLVLHTMKSGYQRVALGRKRRDYVHRLVLEAFRGMAPPGTEGRHVNDRHRSNNAIDNLEWGTRTENMEDARRHGTIAAGERNGSRKHPERLLRGAARSALSAATCARGEGHWNARLSDDEVMDIRASVEPRSVVAARYGIHEMYVSRLRRGRRRSDAGRNAERTARTIMVSEEKL